MSSSPSRSHRRGIVYGLVLAPIFALIGYGLGYVLFMLASQNFIMVTVANISSTSVIHNVVLSQYAGSTLLPYLFAFLLGVAGLALGYLEFSPDA